MAAAARRRPGTPPKGERKAITCRVPLDQHRVYEQAARDAGYASLGDYVGALLAVQHNLEVPPYARPRADHGGAEALPLSA